MPFIVISARKTHYTIPVRTKSSWRWTLEFETRRRHQKLKINTLIKNSPFCWLVLIVSHIVRKISYNMQPELSLLRLQAPLEGTLIQPTLSRPVLKRLSNSCYLTRLSHHPWFDHPHDIFDKHRYWKLVILQFFQLPIIGCVLRPSFLPIQNNRKYFAVCVLLGIYPASEV